MTSVPGVFSAGDVPTRYRQYDSGGRRLPSAIDAELVVD